MFFSVEQAFVGRDEKRAPLKNACVGGYPSSRAFHVLARFNSPLPFSFARQATETEKSTVR